MLNCRHVRSQFANVWLFPTAVASVLFFHFILVQILSSNVHIASANDAAVVATHSYYVPQSRKILLQMLSMAVWTRVIVCVCIQ